MTFLTLTPARPPLRYHGGKWKLASWIVRHFPPHRVYLEPFGGGASVLLNKPRAELETYNDLDGQVVNFFRVLRERPAELVRMLELTPWSRAEYELSYEPSEDALEAARRFFVRSSQSIGGPTTQWRNGWRYQVKRGTWHNAASLWCELDHLYQVAERLRGVQIEQRDAFDLIPRYDMPEVLIYLDPPYPHETRSKWKGAAYNHELSDDEHARLAEMARASQANVVISSYPSEMYTDLYQAHGWIQVTTTARTNGPQTVRTECLWLSPRTQVALDGCLISHRGLPDALQ